MPRPFLVAKEGPPQGLHCQVSRGPEQINRAFVPPGQGMGAGKGHPVDRGAFIGAVNRAEKGLTPFGPVHLFALQQGVTKAAAQDPVVKAGPGELPLPVQQHFGHDRRIGHHDHATAADGCLDERMRQAGL